MSQLTLSALAAMRVTCAKASRELTGDTALEMERMDALLGRLLAEHTDVSALAHRAAEELNDELGGPQGLSWQETLARSSRAIAALPPSPDSLSDPLLRAAVASEMRYWAEYAQVTRAAMEPVPVPQDEPEVGADLDVEAFLTFVRDTFPLETSLEVADVRAASLGYSKRTLLVTFSGARDLPDQVALRIDQANSHLGTTVRDEYPIVTSLFTAGVRVPEPLAFGEDEVLGQPFIMFARVPGRSIGSNFLMPPRDDKVVSDFATELATLHAVPLADVGWSDDPDDLRAALDREIADYRRTWMELGADCPLAEAAFTWIEINRDLGDGGRPAMVHNDFSMGNVLYDEDGVTAIVDWEMAYPGVQGADLGYFYFAACEVASWDHFLAEYVAAGGVLPPRETLDFYILWGQLRMLVMCFQAELAFVRGVYDNVKYGVIGPRTLPEVVDRVGGTLVRLLAGERTTPTPVA